MSQHVNEVSFDNVSEKPQQQWKCNTSVKPTTPQDWASCQGISSYTIYFILENHVLWA